MSPRMFIALFLSLSAAPAAYAKESPACAAQDVRRALAGRLSTEECAAPSRAQSAAGHGDAPRGKTPKTRN